MKIPDKHTHYTILWAAKVQCRPGGKGIR